MLALLSSYHRWAYEQLFSVLDLCSDQDYRSNKGLFFGSLHGTLNHLLLADRLWLSRFQATPMRVEGLNQELESDRVDLKAAILNQAQAWIDFIASLDEANLPDTLVYHNTHGDKKILPYCAALHHVFNHATHHRGQLSAVLTQLGFEAPVMDLVYFLPQCMQ